MIKLKKKFKIKNEMIVYTFYKDIEIPFRELVIIELSTKCSGQSLNKNSEWFHLL